MNRRAFLGGSLLGSLGLAASWRVGYDTPRVVTIPTGVDETLPCPSLFTIDQLQKYPRLARFYADEYAQTDSQDRNVALYIQSIVHMAKAYGVAPAITSVDEFLSLDRAQCGDYAQVQLLLNRQYGLTSRRMGFADGWHTWIEVEINGAFELFDSTSNVWISQPMSALLAGADRRYRMLYAPALDPDAPPIYRAHLQEGLYPGYYDVAALRRRLPFLGKERGVSLPGIERSTADPAE